MAFKKRGGNDKYLRLTGLWPSKSNDKLFTGKLKQEQIEDLLNKIDEAKDNDAPLMFSLWENDKKQSRKDPEFSLQCFVGDSEESPRSRRNSGSSRRDEREEEEEAPRKKRKPVDEEPEEEQAEEPEEAEEEEEVEEEKPRKKGASTRKSSREEEAPRGKTKKRESW